MLRAYLGTFGITHWRRWEGGSRLTSPEELNGTQGEGQDDGVG